jgi:hypothetical protein
MKKKQVPKKPWKDIVINRQTVKVFLVDGNFIRENIYVEFLFGGHNLAARHKFIPKGEIWIEQILKGVDRDAILVHESHEYNLMKNKRLSYVHAHKLANLKEKRFRNSK